MRTYSPFHNLFNVQMSNIHFIRESCHWISGSCSIREQEKEKNRIQVALIMSPDGNSSAVKTKKKLKMQIIKLSLVTGGGGLIWHDRVIFLFLWLYRKARAESLMQDLAQSKWKHINGFISPTSTATAARILFGLVLPRFVRHSLSAD